MDCDSFCAWLEKNATPVKNGANTYDRAERLFEACQKVCDTDDTWEHHQTIEDLSLSY